MNCKETMQAFLNASEKSIACDNVVEQHLAECDACRKEAAEIDQLFDAINKEVILPAPPAIRKTFEIALADEIARSKKTVVPGGATFPFRFLAAACVLLLAGIGIGYLLTVTNDSRPTTTSKANQTESVSAIPDQSSSDRIEMINTSVETGAPEDSLLATLTGILANDKNANVRMAALYALTKYADEPYVYKRLVSCLARETEPVIQVLLINLLIEKKELAP